MKVFPKRHDLNEVNQLKYYENKSQLDNARKEVQKETCVV